MRKIICSALAILLLLPALASCRQSDNTVTDSQQSQQSLSTSVTGISIESKDINTVNSSPFDSYNSILNLYEIYSELIWESYKSSIFPENIYLSNDANETEREWCKQTFDAMYSLQYYLGAKNIDEKTFKSSYGYAFGDLNKDGTDELLLITVDYNLLAVYTMYESSPVLLKCFSQRSNGWIDENGKIHECSSGSASSTVISTFEIRGSFLVLISEYGCDDADNLYYKKTETGAAFSIAKDEFDSAFEREFLSLEDGAEYTKNNSGLKYKPIVCE